MTVSRWAWAALAMLACARAPAQLDDYSRVGGLGPGQIRVALSKPPLSSLATGETSVIDLYRLHYRSTDLHDLPVVLSGLLAVPRFRALKGLVLYYHGTTFDRSQSPSAFTGSNGTPEPEVVTLAFAAAGYAVAMPDYLGLGDSPGVHPYPLGDFNSRSGIDMIGPAREVISKVGMPSTGSLFITGYSEGGAAAMWAVRHLEESGDPAMRPALAAPMSGPYDLSGVTARSMLQGRQNLPGLAIKLYLISYAAYSHFVNFSEPLNDDFAPSFASYIPHVFRHATSDEEIAKKLVFKGIQEGALDSIARVLTPSFRAALSGSATGNSIMEELRRNNCYDWTPHTKTLLPYLTTDSIVVPENTQEALQAMSGRAGRGLVAAYPIVDLNLNHITAIIPALLAARKFFDTGEFPGGSQGPVRSWAYPRVDPNRNTAVIPMPNIERDVYNIMARHLDVIDEQVKGNPDVVLIGDSITNFWGGLPKAPEVNGPKSWVDTFHGLRVLNMGFGWDRTQNVLWRLHHLEFVGITPQTVVLNIGTNNLVGDPTSRTNTPEEVADGIGEILSVLQDRSPTSMIYVMGVFPRGFQKGNDLDRRIQRLNGILAKRLHGKRGVTFLDIGDKLRQADGSISKEIFFDGTHPTDKGYSIWGQALKEAGAIPKPRS